MFDTELYQQVLGLTAPWKVTDVRLDVESKDFRPCGPSLRLPLELSGL
jgi:hypothetical protein